MTLTFKENTMSTINVKELGHTFKFEINYNRVARIWVGDKKTPYIASGYGYDKASTVIANMINNLIGTQPYNTEIYGSFAGLLSPGTGFRSIKESFESIEGNKLDFIYEGSRGSEIYEITLRKVNKIKEREQECYRDLECEMCGSTFTEKDVKANNFDLDLNICLECWTKMGKQQTQHIIERNK